MPWNQFLKQFVQQCQAALKTSHDGMDTLAKLAMPWDDQVQSVRRCQEVWSLQTDRTWSNHLNSGDLDLTRIWSMCQYQTIPSSSKLWTTRTWHSLWCEKNSSTAFLSTGPISGIVLSKRSSSNLIYFLMKQNEEVLKEATKAQRQITQVRESVGLMASRSWEICPCFHLHTIYIGEKTVTMTVMKMALMLAKGYKMYWMDGWCFVMMTITIMIILYHNHNHDCDHRSVK